MIISRSIRVATNGVISFFSMAEECSIVCMYHIFFLLSFAGGHLYHSYALAVVNVAAVNIGNTCILLNSSFL